MILELRLFLLGFLNQFFRLFRGLNLLIIDDVAPDFSYRIICVFRCNPKITRT